MILGMLKVPLSNTFTVLDKAFENEPEGLIEPFEMVEQIALHLIQSFDD